MKNRNLEPKRVLIIDDDEPVSMALGELLKTDGFHVSISNNAADGVERSKEGNFDFVIVDYRMPGMNGAEVTKLLRQKFRDLFIIGFSSESKSEEFLEAGADVFYEKTSSLQKLLSFMTDRARHTPSIAQHAGTA